MPKRARLISLMVSSILDRAVNGNPVGVDVEEAHEDADHHATVVEIDILLSLFHYNHLAVGRSHYNALRLSLEGADGTLEEVQQDTVENGTNRNTDVEGIACFEHVQYREVEHYEYDSAPK